MEKVSAVILSVLALALNPSVLIACSLMPPWGDLSDPSTIHMIGTATRDTMAAGPGAFKIEDGEGDFGHAVSKPIYGQVVSVTRFSRNAPPALRSAVATHENRVVLVPWAYGPDCSTAQWAQSARWLEDDASGLFSARLRDEAHWVNGVPTLDVYAPQFAPYPVAVRRRGILYRATPAPDSMLTPLQLLQLFEATPSSKDIETRLDTAAAPLRAWIAAHPELAARFPVPETLATIRRTVSQNLLVRRTVPLAGTYRVTIISHENGSLIYHARTSAHPTSVLGGTEDRPAGATANPDTSAKGVYVLACAARSVAELPRRQRCRLDQKRVSQGFFAFLDSASSDRSGVEERQGSIDLLGRARHWNNVFAGDTASIGFLQRATATISAATANRPPSFTPGFFRKLRNGRVVYERLVVVGGAVVLRIQAERISAETFAGH